MVKDHSKKKRNENTHNRTSESETSYRFLSFVPTVEDSNRPISSFD